MEISSTLREFLNKYCTNEGAGFSVSEEDEKTIHVGDLQKFLTGRKENFEDLHSQLIKYYQRRRKNEEMKWKLYHEEVEKQNEKDNLIIRQNSGFRANMIYHDAEDLHAWRINPHQLTIGEQKPPEIHEIKNFLMSRNRIFDQDYVGGVLNVFMEKERQRVRIMEMDMKKRYEEFANEQGDDDDDDDEESEESEEEEKKEKKDDTFNIDGKIYPRNLLELCERRRELEILNHRKVFLELVIKSIECQISDIVPEECYGQMMYEKWRERKQKN